MFIGTSDYKTVEEFSKRCGNFSVITRNVGYNTVKADDINSNASIKERPLIYPSELSQLNRPGDMGHAIVTVFGYQPIRSEFTPSYAATAYTLEKTVQRLGVGRYFDEEKIFYDMKKRNETIAPRRRPIGGKRASEAVIQQNINAALEKLKSDAERLITKLYQVCAGGRRFGHLCNLCKKARLVKLCILYKRNAAYGGRNVFILYAG